MRRPQDPVMAAYVRIMRVLDELPREKALRVLAAVAILHGQDDVASRAVAGAQKLERAE